MIDAEIGERFGGQVPQIVVGRRGPERAHSSWVSEDRRSTAARWGAWAARIRRITGPRPYAVTGAAPGGATHTAPDKPPPVPRPASRGDRFACTQSSAGAWATG